MSMRKKYSLDECHLGQPASEFLSEAELHFTSPPKLHMLEASPPCRSVLLTAAALGVPLELIIVNVLQGEHLQADFVMKNPQHTIPLLEDNDFCIWDSHAICTYLAAAYGRTDELYPKETRRRAVVDQRLHFDSSVTSAVFYDAFRGVMMRGEKPIPESKVEQFMTTYGLLDAFLAGTTWLAGSEVTVADLCSLPMVMGAADLVPIPEDRFPNVVSWIDNCKTLPYYESANSAGQEEFSKLVQGILSA